MELHVWADDRRAASGEDGLDIGDIAAIAIALAKVERGVGRETRGREGLKLQKIPCSGLRMYPLLF